jgi:hypothetical protein
MAWPSILLILLICLSTPIQIEAGRKSTTPCFSAERPGPRGTIAKENGERKEKPQKRQEKCRFFWGVWKSPPKQRVERMPSPARAAVVEALDTIANANVALSD